jgi:hypothetical protein
LFTIYSVECVEGVSVLKNELVGRARNPHDR